MVFPKSIQETRVRRFLEICFTEFCKHLLCRAISVMHTDFVASFSGFSGQAGLICQESSVNGSALGLRKSVESQLGEEEDFQHS